MKDHLYMEPFHHYWLWKYVYMVGNLLLNFIVSFAIFGYDGGVWSHGIKG